MSDPLLRGRRVGPACPPVVASLMEDVLAAPQNRPGNDGWGDANFISSNLILELITQMQIRECL